MQYPDACYSLVSDSIDPLFAGDKAKLGFRESHIQGAIDRAQRAHLAASAMDLGWLHERTKAALADCIELSKDTVSNLQRSMASSSNDGSQTWLSAALANQQTCLNGFADFDMAAAEMVSKLPFMTSNITELLSNSLAINKASMPTSISGGKRRLLSDKRGFPTWVSAADRKLLQASGSINADLVVAQDGSGNYKTISEAVADSASKRVGTKRFVIHVKAGVYTESVVITNSMRNLMIICDSIDATVVTGSRCWV